MITIELDRQTADFRPADSITGTILWADLEDESQRLELRLIWYTSGKGTRDVELVETLTFSTEGRNAGKSPFEFTAPHRPYSFSGKLLSVTWAIELIEFPNRESTNQEISISPSGTNIELNQDYTEGAAGSLLSRMRFGPSNG